MRRRNSLSPPAAPRFRRQPPAIDRRPVGFIPVTPTPGLARALPAALACSANQARQLVRRLPPQAVQRLRTAALCLAHVQRCLPLLPLALVERILCSAVDDA